MGFDLSGYSCKKCRSRTGFIFQPKKNAGIGLKKLSLELEGKGASINALTRLLLVAKFRGTMFSFYANGKIMVKAETEEKARKALEALA